MLTLGPLPFLPWIGEQAFGAIPNRQQAAEGQRHEEEGPARSLV